MAKYLVRLNGVYDQVLHSFEYPRDPTRHIEAGCVDCKDGALVFYRDKETDRIGVQREIVGGFPLAVVASFGLQEEEEK